MNQTSGMVTVRPWWKQRKKEKLIYPVTSTSKLSVIAFGTVRQFLEQPVQVIYLLIFYVNIFHILI